MEVCSVITYHVFLTVFFDNGNNNNMHISMPPWVSRNFRDGD